MSETTFDLLPRERWAEIAPIIRGDFEDAMPRSDIQTSFLAAMKGGEIKGFVQAERIFHLTNLYTAEDERASRLGFQLMREIDKRIPSGYSMIMLTDEERIARLAQKLGAKDRGVWRMIRKDYW